MTKIKKYYHEKLVRDKIPQVIESNGGKGNFKILSEKKYEEELKKKLLEESKELAKAPNEDILNELADVLEVIKSIADHNKIRFSKVEEMQIEKRKKRGGFKKKLFLVWSSQPSGK